MGSGHPLRQIVGDLVTSTTTAWIELRPLSVRGVAALAAGHGVAADVLHARTGGNPFYVTEALASPDAEVPATVRLAVLARASRLAPPSREVLEAVAVVPGRAERWLVDAVCGAPAEAVEACLAAGVLTDDDGTLAFRHELARLAVWAETPAGRRRDLHRRVLRSLGGATGVDPARPAHHAAAAGDRRALAHWSALACTAAAARTADRVAVRHGEQALALVGELEPAAAAELRTAVARSLVVLARAEEAEPLASAAVAHWQAVGDVRREADALTVRSSATMALGATGAAMIDLELAVSLLESQPAGSELGHACVRLASAHMLARERDRSVEWGERAIAVATAIGDTALLGRALVETGTADLVDGRLEGLERVRRAIDLGRRHDLPGVVTLGFSQIGSGCGELRRHDLAVPALVEGIEVAREHAVEALLRYQLAWLARCRLDLGEWDAAEALARESLRGRPSLIARFVGLNTTGWLRARRGDDDVWPALDEAHAIARRIGHLQRLWPSAIARAEAGWLARDPDPHVDALREAHALAVRHHHRVAIGETGVWLQRVGAPVPQPDDVPEPFASWWRGDHARAATLLGAGGFRYEEAWARSATGDPVDLGRAVAALQQLGAAPLLARLVPAGGARPHQDDASRPGGLSAREIEVLRLVAAGFSNPQIATALFISRKTAEHHVSHILTKLGLATRAGAAAAAVRLGLLD